MLASERKEKMLRAVQTNGYVQVADLTKEMNVTPMTIRRDLTELEEQGVLVRCHGGAVLRKEKSFQDKQKINIPVKKKLAKCAAELVKPNMTVFLDAGTTTYQIAQQIKDLGGITILTTDIEIAHLLCQSNARILMIGGVVQNTIGACLGYYTTEILKQFEVDLSFVGSSGISDDYYSMIPTMEKAFLKRQERLQARKSYLVTDESKFGINTGIRVDPLSAYDGVITNKTFQENELEHLLQQQIHIIPVV
jgi:DeoR family fructose operon transcriptional repressor